MNIAMERGRVKHCDPDYDIFEIGSIQYQQTITIHTKRVFFMILPLLFVPYYNLAAGVPLETTLVS